MTRGAELQRIAQEGKRIRTVHLEVRVTASPFSCEPGSCTRVGLIIPRFRQSAVARNRLKRQLRELTRARLLPSNIVADIVIRIRPDAYRASFGDLGLDIDKARRELLRWKAASVNSIAGTKGLQDTQGNS